MRTLIPLLSITLLLCSAAEANEAGQQWLAPFKSDLKQALMAGLAQGPEHALSVCRSQAPELARRYSVDGVRMGRSSDKLRNPQNAPPEWVIPVMQQYRSGDLAPVTVALNPERMGYVEPIMIAPPCLQCHGTHLSPSIEQALAEHYPEDQATGYQPGQWRGVFWLEYPTE
ncbi:DUF3365 domain-containing protein [Marinobacter hydrocarbonoclasticus]|nr:DUF3365 domain-containing protein [Marinobacter nauticus]